LAKVGKCETRSIFRAVNEGIDTTELIDELIRRKLITDKADLVMDNEREGKQSIDAKLKRH